MRTTESLPGTIAQSTIVQAALVMTASVFLPFFIHQIPSQGALPWGARLLAMFYAPFVALFFFSPSLSILCALSAPWLNYLLIGMPLQENAAGLSVELFLFVLISYGLLKIMKRSPLTAPCAYLLSQAALAPLGLLHTAFLLKIGNGLPGILTMFLINGYLIYLRGDSDS